MRSDRLSPYLAVALLLSAACRGDDETASDRPPAPPTGPLSWPAPPTAPRTVRALALGDDGTVYVGGDFTRAGPMTGSGVPVDLDSGQPLATYPKVDVDGVVLAAAPDGAGGWYVGGAFARIGAEARESLAHVLPDGTVDASWAPSLRYSPWTPRVEALAVANGVVYVGGLFDTLGGEPRSALGAVDAAGQVTAFAPDVTAAGTFALVSAIAPRGTTILFGGSFDAVGGEARAHLAEVDATTGSVTAWNPGVEGGSALVSVDALAVLGDTVYLAGSFDRVSGQPREGLAAVDASGVATAWNPVRSGPYPYVHSVAVDAGTLYVGGSFESIDGQPRAGLAAFDASGALTGWSPELAPPWVFAIAARAGTVYAAGTFTRAGGLVRRGLAAFEASGAPTTWDPDRDDVGFVEALSASAGSVYVGGSFRWIGKASRRAGLAAIDPNGQVLPWNPGVEGAPADPATGGGGSAGAVHALAVMNGTVYAGGDFVRVGGVERKNLAAIDASGAVTPWNPGSDGPVFALAAAGDTLHVGGRFGRVGGLVRWNLAALKASGEVTGWNPGPNAFVTALAAEGDTVYAGGYFTAIGLEPRTNLAAIRADGTLAPLAARFSDAAGFASRLDASAPLPTGVWALAVSGTTVYVSGDFRAVGGQPRLYLAAIDAAGEPTPFALPFEVRSPMMALAVTQGTLFAGGTFPPQQMDDGWGYPLLAAVSLDRLPPVGYGLALATAPDDAATSVTWRGEPKVQALAARDGTAYVGGSLWGMPTRPDRRWNLAAVDTKLATLPWDPNAFP